MRKVIRLLVSLLLAATAASTLAQEEKGVVLKADKLVAEPFADAKQVGTVAKGDAVVILKKKGGWFQIKGAGAPGWVRMLSVRRGEAAKGNAAKDIAALSTGRAGTGQIVSNTGVRGLGEEDLKAARYDENELKKAESFRVSKTDAQAFARKAGLQAQTVNHLAVK